MNQQHTASVYSFGTIDDMEHFFLQRKLGNYVYGGADPNYYVLTLQP